MLENEEKIALAMRSYFEGAVAIGISRDRAQAVLDEEIAASQSSPTLTTFSAIERASRRLRS